MSEWGEFFRWAGVAIALALLVLSIAIIRQGAIGKHASLSLHAASKKQSYISLGLFLTFGGALFYGFIAFWVIPTYALDTSAYSLLIFAYLAQLGMAWVPASTTNKKSQSLHLFFGVIVASAMVLFLGLLAINASSLPPLSALFIPIGTLVTLATLIVYTFVCSWHKYFLVFEMVFIAFFCMAMILLALQL